MGRLNSFKSSAINGNSNENRGQQSTEAILILGGILLVGIVVGAVLLNLGGDAGSGNSSAIVDIKGAIQGLGGSPAAYFFNITNPPATWAMESGSCDLVIEECTI